MCYMVVARNFSRQSEGYLGDFKRVRDQIFGHLYVQNKKNVRARRCQLPPADAPDLLQALQHGVDPLRALQHGVDLLRA